MKRSSKACCRSIALRQRKEKEARNGFKPEKAASQIAYNNNQKKLVSGVALQTPLL